MTTSHTSMFRPGPMNARPHSHDANAIYFQILSTDGHTSITGFCSKAEHAWLMERIGIRSDETVSEGKS